MDKNELLVELSGKLKTGEIVPGEILCLIGERDTGDQTAVGSPVSEKPHFKLSQILYYLGAAIVFIGIAIMVGQNWDVFNSPTRILLTFGIGLVAYIIGVLFSRGKDSLGPGDAFFLISGMLIPTGIGIVLNEAGVNTQGVTYQLLISGLSFGVFIASFFLFKRILFLIFLIIFGTWLTLSAVSWVYYLAGGFVSEHSAMYQIMSIGLAYMLLGHSFDNTERKPLTGILYSFGLIAFLSSTMALGGFQSNANMFWELIYPGLVFAVIFLSIYLKSKAFLVFGTLYLMGYIMKITLEYFAEGLGWSISLIVAGLLLIAIGYGAVKLNEKFIKKQI
jgi:hypothetical protein